MSIPPVSASIKSDPLLAQDQCLRREADYLLENMGLRHILSQYGIPHIVGSFTLQLMAWRDLDIYLETEAITVSDFFALGERIASVLSPVRMSFRNERIAQTEGLPRGLYWGVYSGYEIENAWKIDIWAIDSKECRRLLEYQNNLATRLTPTARLKILDIKSQCWQDPEYRRSFKSIDIYDAVFNQGIVDISGFREYIRRKQPI